MEWGQWFSSPGSLGISFPAPFPASAFFLLNILFSFWLSLEFYIYLGLLVLIFKNVFIYF